MGKTLFTITVEASGGGYFVKCKTSAGRVYMDKVTSRDALAEWLGRRGHNPVPGAAFPTASSRAAKRIVEHGMQGRR